MAVECSSDVFLALGGSRPTPRARSRSRRASPAAEPASRGRELLESHYDLVRQRLDHVSRRSGLPEHESEEFRSWAMSKLVEDDYRVLARWQGRSSFSTFLTVVLVNLMRDYRVRIWGKWRPSAEARRQGREAVLLERLWLRDGLPLDEAIDRVRTGKGAALSRAELEQIAGGLSRRLPRWRVGEEELESLGVDGQVEARVEDGERARLAAEVEELLLPLLRALPAEDRLLLKLHFQDGLTIAAISPLLGRPQRELYTWRDRCLKKVRRALEEAGLNARRVSALTQGPGWELAARPAEVWE